jgi:UDPglucose 6-dehydrogenase
MKNYKIGVMGVGMVGGAMARFFESSGIKPIMYDPPRGLDNKEELNKAEMVFVCVPTPYDEEKGGFDLSFVRSAISILDGEKIVVLKSTVLPGSTDALQAEFQQHKLLFNPEFLTESTADQDMRYPDRQIVGYTEKSFNVAKDVMLLLPLAPFERIVPAKVAEVVKYFNNTWFATKVVFANQIYDVCEKLNVDYELARDCAAADKRIGPSHLQVFHKGYRGYGGKCLPKDTRAFIQLGERLGAEQKLLKTVEEINNFLVSRSDNKNI